MKSPFYSFNELLGNNIEQTANTYKLNDRNKALIKLAKAKLKQLSLSLLKHLLILIFVIRVIILRMLSNYFSNKLGFNLD